MTGTAMSANMEQLVGELVHMRAGMQYAPLLPYFATFQKLPLGRGAVFGYHPTHRTRGE